jgi:hypothetical protein
MPVSGTWQSCTVLLPVVTETEALRETIAVIESSSGADVREYVMLVCARTSPESLAVCEAFVRADPERFRVHRQALPGLGGAIREGFATARGTHVLMMASDLETDPAVVAEMLARSKGAPDAVVTASRWLSGGGFEGYGALKVASNYLFQKLFSKLYATHLTDMTYGFRVFPTELVRSIAWEELGHPFLFETILKPLRLGATIHEIPARWKTRPEGESQGARGRSLGYVRTGLRIRFRPRADIRA